MWWLTRDFMKPYLAVLISLVAYNICRISYKIH